MYFIDIKGLKKDIVDKNFTESNRFTYIMVYLLLDAFFMETCSYLPSDSMPTIIDYALSFISVISLFLGAYFIFKANGGNQGEDFAGRFFSLTWVRSIQFLLILIPIILVLGTLNESVLHLSDFNSEIAYFVLYSSFLFAVYYYAYRDVLEIRGEN